MGIIVSILVLSFLIFFHELGHFLAARIFGVKVLAFSIGFGKQRLWKKTIGDTEYSIRPIFLGGFVELKGQKDFDPKNRDYSPDSLYGISHIKRIIILAAGSLFNLLLAFLLFLCVAFIDHNDLAPVVGNVDKDKIAYKAGIIDNDEIIEVNGKKIKTWWQLSKIVEDSNGENLEIVFLRDNKEYVVNIMPQIGDSKNIFGEDIKRALIGISAKGEIRTISYNFLESIEYAYFKTIQSSKLIVQGIERLIIGVLPTSEIGGIVSIVTITKQASESGIVMLLAFAAMLSVNLGILNLLPIPALDGGHIVFATYEMIVRKPASINAIYYLTICGWVILLSLMILGMYNDITKLLNGSLVF